MAVKQIQVQVPGGGISATVGISPETTAREILNQLGLGTGYFLYPPSGNTFYQPTDKLSDIPDGTTLVAAPWAEVGCAGPLEILPVVGVIFLAAALCVVLVVPGKDSAKSEGASHAQSASSQLPAASGAQGKWQSSGDRYSGYYAVNGTLLQGDVIFRSRWDNRFCVFAPATLIAACGEHARCFIPKSRPRSDGQRWYEVHFTERPDTVFSGIVAIQETLRHDIEKQ